MASYKLLAYCALCLTSCSLIRADLGPYFRSTSYEHGAHGRVPQQLYHSSDLLSPILNIHQHGDQCDDGQLILLTVLGSGVSSPGPMILDGQGNLVWTDPYYGDSWGLDVQLLDGEPHLTFCAWPGRGPHVTCHVLNSEYEEVYKVLGKNGWGADATELQITQQKTAVLTTSTLIQFDLGPVNGPRQGWMRDVGFQEIDLETGEVLFQWSWSDHWDITDVFLYPNGTEGSRETPWDAFHINSVHKDSVGNYLISSRHTSTVGYVNGQNGDFIWTLGGKRNMFKDLSGGAATNISMQHHPRFLIENATLTLFDNGVKDPSNLSIDYRSRGLIIDIDTDAMTAKVAREYPSPHRLGSESRGSMQMLDNDRVLVGYGINPGWSEFSTGGDLICDVHFGPESGFRTEDILSYRVLKSHWVGLPKTLPSIVRKGGDIYVSWNGATEVATWTLVASDADLNDYTSLGSVPTEGFETRIPVPSTLTASGVRVIGIDRNGSVLGLSPILQLARPAQELFQQQPLVSSSS
ncbi:hypothetical protein SAMD00023353_4301120 [Rosellinia necatrix]|uniref:Arylsulfotransferase protein n=1 Tax=Rosellinia necatrix TaxID=77044 RepID=A0A1W2TNX1_ROSNE|nr:hypothetical protein SAMD00023353_4301120 [Rosellinia necatrix]